MGIIGDSLDKAAAATFTRPIPATPGAQIRYLVKQAKGSTRVVAQALGVSQRTVERYLKGQIRRPRPDLAARLADEVRRRWQPRIHERARRQAATSTGIIVEARARFGYTAAPERRTTAASDGSPRPSRPFTRPVSSPHRTPVRASRSCGP